VPDSTELVSRSVVLTMVTCSASARSERVPERGAGLRCAGLSIAAFEGSKDDDPFQLEYDLSLAGKATLEPLEQQGLALFNDRGKCAGCHVDDAAAASAFTDFTFDTWEFLRILRIHLRHGQNLVDGQAVNPLGSIGWLRGWVVPGNAGPGFRVEGVASRHGALHDMLMPQSPRWFRTTRQAPGRLCVTWTRPTRTSSKPTATMVSSRASKESVHFYNTAIRCHLR